MSQPAEEFSRYRQMIGALALPALRAAAPADPATPDVRLGVTPARLLLEDQLSDADGQALADGLAALATLARGRGAGGVGGAGEVAGPVVPVRLRAPGGEARDEYLPLVLHLHLRAFSRHYESLSVRHWSACESALDDAIAPLRGIEQALIESNRDGASLTLWRALCLLDQALLVRRDVDVELVDSVVHELASRPGPGGSLHEFSDGPEGESLDAWTYRELVGVHALANLALLRRNRAWAARVKEVATYHLENTQPDNTTSQPWGVFAFAWSPQTRSFAGQQVHDATAAQAMTQMGDTGVNALSAMLLADAFDAMREFA